MACRELCIALARVGCFWCVQSLLGSVDLQRDWSVYERCTHTMPYASRKRAAQSVSSKGTGGFKVIIHLSCGLLPKHCLRKCIHIPVRTKNVCTEIVIECWRTGDCYPVSIHREPVSSLSALIPHLSQLIHTAKSSSQSGGDSAEKGMQKERATICSSARGGCNPRGALVGLVHLETESLQKASPRLTTTEQILGEMTRRVPWVERPRTHEVPEEERVAS